MGLWTEGLSKIEQAIKSVSFDKQLFLMIKLSILNKLLCFAKAEGLQAIKNLYSISLHKRSLVKLFRSERRNMIGEGKAIVQQLSYLQ